MTDIEHDTDDAPLDERNVERLGALLRGTLTSASFADGFADRTMARLAASRAVASPAVMRFAAMQRSFRFVAAAAAVLIVALGVNNMLLVRSADASVIEAAIGLQPVSVESLLSSNVEALQ